MSSINVINEGLTTKELSTLELSTLYGGDGDTREIPCWIQFTTCGAKVCGANQPCAGKGNCGKGSW